MPELDLNSIELYVVRNQEGQFFRAKGYGGYGPSWVDEFAKAKVYTKLSQARSRRTFFANTYPKYGVPDIVRLVVGGMEVLDETKYMEKVKRQRETKEERRKAAETRANLRRAEEELRRAQAQYDKLKGRG